MRKKNEQNKDLQEIKTSWDFSLVNQLRKETSLTNDDIKKITNNEHGVINRSKIKKKYKELQEYSDLLGLPVWALMKEDTAKEVIPSVNEDLDINIKPYRISDLEEILNYISVQTECLSLSDEDNTHVNLLVDILKKILKPYERWSDTWRGIFSLKQEQLKKFDDFNWTCNLLFTYNNEIIYRGTLRFYKKKLTDLPLIHSKGKDSLKTSWLFIKKMVPSATKPRLILSIVDDISTEILKCQQPHITLNTENDDEMLFSWNSNFNKNVVTLPDLKSSFRNRMKDFNSLSLYTAFLINEHFYKNEHELESFNKNLLMDETFDFSPQNINTLDYLLVNGYIKEGDHILFKNEADPSDYEYAEIFIDRKVMLLWRGDIYHFTNLTNKLISSQQKETTPNYCAKYWYLPGRQYSLYELAKFIKMVHKF